MKYHLPVSLVLMIAVTSNLFGGELVKKEFKTAEGDTRKTLILKCGNKESVLPLRSAYVSEMCDAKKNIWAINYHETSNYSGVDMVVCNQGSPQILSNVFVSIEAVLVGEKIIPNWKWDNQIFEVQEIIENRMTCRFYGTSHLEGKTYETVFYLLVETLHGKIKLTPQQKK